MKTDVVKETYRSRDVSFTHKKNIMFDRGKLINY